MEKMVFIISSILSCLIVVHIIMQHMNEKYEKRLKGKIIYIIIECIAIALMTMVNLIGNSTINLLVWLFLVALLAGLLYKDNNVNAIKMILECEVILLVMSVFEGLGVLLLNTLLEMMNINIQSGLMKTCLEITFSKVFILFVYYMIINRIFGGKVIPSRGLYGIYLVVFIYSFYNMLVIAHAFENGEINTNLTINMGCIVLAVLFLIHFIRVANEKSFLEYEYKVLEKQTDMQYKFYLQQEKKHNKTVQILHDVNKHVKAIEQLYSNGKIELANEYTGEITTILKPLIPIKYTGNPILDIILTDKKMIATEKGIDFDVKINNVDLNFIDAVELTTIFGNLLDNAVEACEEVEDKKSISLNIQPFHEMVSIKLKNTCKKVKWKNGVPISEKGSNRGIGLRNVKRCVEKYNGDINFKEDEQYFIVDMFLNS